MAIAFVNEIVFQTVGQSPNIYQQSFVHKSMLKVTDALLVFQQSLFGQ